MHYFKFKHIIKKSLKKTMLSFKDKNPKISDNLFYGAFDIVPESLVIRYLFETDEELKNAESSGFCCEIIEATINNLISSGYPSEAFKTREKSFVSFTTWEDIDNKSDGDIHLYFQ